MSLFTNNDDEKLIADAYRATMQRQDDEQSRLKEESPSPAEVASRLIKEGHVEAFMQAGVAGPDDKAEWLEISEEISKQVAERIETIKSNM